MKCIRILGLCAGIGLGLWLGGYVMLYGGIVGAIHATTTGGIVGNAIRAMFFVVGFFPGLFLAIATGFMKGKR